MEKLSKLIEDHLRSNGLRYDEKHCGSADKGFLVPYRGTTVAMLCGVAVHEDDRRIMISVFSGLMARPEKIQAAYEIVARANNGLGVGAFWIEPDSGDVSFNLGAAVVDMTPTDSWIHSAICTAIHTYDHYYPALSQVLYADADPAEAVAGAEGPSDDEVTKTVSKLMKNVSDKPEPSSTETDQTEETAENRDAEEPEKKSPKKDKPSKPRPANSRMVIRVSNPLDLVAKITQEDLDRIIGEVNRKDNTESREEGKTDETA